MNKLVIGHDVEVAAWAFATANTCPMQFNLAVGIVNDAGKLCGAFMFTGYNGSEAEIHYYGPGTLKRNVLKDIFLFALNVLKLNRLTVRTRKASMARGVAKLGAVYEGRMKRVYGPSDGEEHAAVQFAFYSERMAEIAGLRTPICAAQAPRHTPTPPARCPEAPPQEEAFPETQRPAAARLSEADRPLAREGNGGTSHPIGIQPSS